MTYRSGIFAVFFYFFFPQILIAGGIPRYCSQHLNDPNMFTNRWGGSIASSLVPPVFYCKNGGSNESTQLANPRMVLESGGSQTWVSAIMSQPQVGIDDRVTQLSFMVPAPGHTHWNHVAVHTTFDSVSFDRIGAAVFKDKLYVQYTSAQCNPNGELLVPASIPGGLLADHWYRAFARTVIKNNTVSVSVALMDLQSGQYIASTIYKSSCVADSLKLQTNRWFVGSASLSPTGVDPLFEVHVADFGGTAL